MAKGAFGDQKRGTPGVARMVLYGVGVTAGYVPL